MKKVIDQSFLFALGVGVYVSGIAIFLTNVEKLLQSSMSFLAPALMLSLLCLSAAIVGGLIFIKPALLTLEGGKSRRPKTIFRNTSLASNIYYIVFH